MTAFSSGRPALATFSLLTVLAIAGCATTDGSGTTPKLPATPPLSVAQAMQNQTYDARHGLNPDDQGYRPY
jgi:hypothetical protein